MRLPSMIALGGACSPAEPPREPVDDRPPVVTTTTPEPAPTTPPDADTGTPPPILSVVTVAGLVGVAGLGADGPAVGSALYWPMDVTLGLDGLPYVMDWNNHRVRRLEVDTSVTTVLAADLTGGIDIWLFEPTTAIFAPDGLLYMVESREVKKVNLVDHTFARLCEGVFGVCDGAPLLPTGVAIDAEGRLIVADVLEGGIDRLDHDGVYRRIAGTGVPGFNGDGPGLETQLFSPYTNGVPLQLSSRIEVAGDILYIADTGNNRIRALDLVTFEITTVAGNGDLGLGGNGGPAVDAALSMPADLAVGSDGAIYVADWSHSCIRVIRGGTIDTLAGTCGSIGWYDAADPLDAAFNHPQGLMVDGTGAVYVADTDNHVVRRIAP